MATVILLILGYKIKREGRMLETKIKIACLTEVQKGIMRDRIENTCWTMSIGDTLETAKQRLSALSAGLKRYTKAG